MDDDASVTRLPVRFRAPPGTEKPQLRLVEPHLSKDGCNHKHYFANSNLLQVTYLVREGETEVECGHCHVKLDPMWVMMQLARVESRFRESEKSAHAAMTRYADRVKTKCEHCKKITRISRT